MHRLRGAASLEPFLARIGREHEEAVLVVRGPAGDHEVEAVMPGLETFACREQRETGTDCRFPGTGTDVEDDRATEFRRAFDLDSSVDAGEIVTHPTLELQGSGGLFEVAFDLDQVVDPESPVVDQHRIEALLAA